jgi:hypothetical protein
MLRAISRARRSLARRRVTRHLSLAASSMIQRAMRIDPTVTELIPTILGELGPLA